VRFEQGGREAREVRVEPGTTLLAAAVQAGLPIAQACGSDGLCARCGVVVLEGGAALSTEEPAERDTKRRNRIDAGERLACQARISGPVLATARYW